MFGIIVFLIVFDATAWYAAIESAIRDLLKDQVCMRSLYKLLLILVLIAVISAVNTFGITFGGYHGPEWIVFLLSMVGMFIVCYLRWGAISHDVIEEIGSGKRIT